MKDVLLKTIQMHDEPLYNRLVSMGTESMSVVVLQSVADTVSKPRKYDKPVTKMNWKKDGVMPSTLKNRFQLRYADVSESIIPGEPGIINIAGVQFTCDIEVVKIIKALLWTGMCQDSKQSRACHDVVHEIIKIFRTTPDVKIDNVIANIQGFDYFTNILVDCIKETTKQQ